MVIRLSPALCRQRGALMTELLVAIFLLVGALLPIAYSIGAEKRAVRACYHHALAMELVDGEMEVLAAGEWKSFAPGKHAYPIRSAAAVNLPPGALTLTLDAQRIRLEWQPAEKHEGGPVVREFNLQ